MRGAWEEARWAPETRRTVLALYVTLALGLLVLGAEFLPPRVALTQAAFRLVQPQTATPAQARPTPARPLPTFLTAGFSLEVAKRLKGQKVTLDQAVLYSKEGKRLGSIPTSACQRLFETEATSTPASQPARQSQKLASITQQPFTGALFLYPLESASLRCGFFSIEKFGLQPGQTIFAVITGRSGFRHFHLKTRSTPIKS
jgi:hypothetical protein